MEISDQDNIFDRLKDLANNLKGNFNIMENQVDIKVQMEYFQYSKEIKKDLDKLAVLEKTENLFDEKASLAEKKHLLSQLASVDDVKAYRAIERFVKNNDLLLKDWAIMALQESRMLLESSLLDENQIFISTGLGGKDSKLRYFLVLFHKSDNSFNETQQKIIKNEFEFILAQNNAEIEEINFNKNVSSIMVLLPIDAAIQNVLQSAIDECNEYGGFIKQNFIITNVKKLDHNEILSFIKDKNIPGLSDNTDINNINEF